MNPLMTYVLHVEGYAKMPVYETNTKEMWIQKLVDDWVWNRALFYYDVDTHIYILKDDPKVRIAAREIFERR